MLALMGRPVLETTTSGAVSKSCLCVHWDAVCPLGEAGEGTIQKSQEGLPAAQREEQRI